MIANVTNNSLHLSTFRESNSLVIRDCSYQRVILVSTGSICPLVIVFCYCHFVGVQNTVYCWM